jgi:ABC-type transport system involved in cytochrome bd biosynthesis fused ATPase/permease subunit
MSQIRDNSYDNYAFYEENRVININSSNKVGFHATENAVKIKNLMLSYGKHEVLNGINMNVPSKRIYGLLGPSGCGMSYALNRLKLFFQFFFQLKTQ